MIEEVTLYSVPGGGGSTSRSRSGPRPALLPSAAVCQETSATPVIRRRAAVKVPLPGLVITRPRLARPASSRCTVAGLSR